MANYNLDGLDEDSPYKPFIINPGDVPVTDLDPFIIGQIIRRKEKQERNRDQPQLPLYDIPDRPQEAYTPTPEKPNRGVVIITPEDRDDNVGGGWTTEI